MAEIVKVSVKHWLTRRVAEEIIWRHLNIKVDGSGELRFDPFEGRRQYRMSLGYTNILIRELGKPYMVSIVLSTLRGNSIDMICDCKTWRSLGELVFLDTHWLDFLDEQIPAKNVYEGVHPALSDPVILDFFDYNNPKLPGEVAADD